ncbi:fibronectin type III domain-containing protein [Paenibacillus sacheonensis]|uniref:Fibronectin type-III domain-containing protein n=1 Tax=Paenibacillus sacheonensis TaxID=742054 RepID=A0A7X5BYW0_9BACL|nr:fibronectin type III domain-containing protein [Paenibacillus sacheonensis]NBC70067.1 hypothetical protein [Paenibacillus sacheonensis]
MKKARKWLARSMALAAVLAFAQPAAAATFDESYYMLFNISPTPPQARMDAELNGIVDSFADAAYVKTGLSISTQYLSLDTYAHQQNYNWDSDYLDRQLQYAADYGRPVLIQLNAGGWAGDTGLMDALADDTRTTMWDTNNWDMFRSIDQHNYMTYSRKNLKHYAFKKRNLQQVAKRIVQWRAQHPDLFIGVSLDSEDWQYVWDSTRYSDYNPLSIAEWKEWLQGTGIYDSANGTYKGEARSPVFTSISQFNTAMGTSFATWSAVDPPRTRADGNPFWEEWTRWRTMLLKHHLQDMSNWLIEAGLPSNRIYAHQNQVPSGSDAYYLTSSITTTAALSPGSLGVTLYGDGTKDTNYFKQLLGYDNNWGAPEYNPTDKSNKASSYDGLVKTYEGGAHFISPLSWNDPVNSPYEIKGTQFEAAISDFIANYGGQRRPARFDIGAPGSAVYDLAANFSSAATANTPSASTGTETVGGVSKNGIFLHAPNAGDATLTYSNVVLPSVTGGERLNLALYSGLLDGADNSDGYIVKAAVNGTNVFTGNYAQPHYSRWHRWEPAMIDLTAYAGQTVTVTLATNKGTNDSQDWIVFGSPAIYKGTPDYTAPSPVSGLNAVTVGSKEIGLTWTPITNAGVVEYKVYRSTTSGFTPSAANFVAFANKGSYNDPGLTSSTTYYYKVAAVDEAGNEGTASAQANANSAAASSAAPGQPTGVTAVLAGDKDSVAVSWSAVSASNLREYRIYRSTKSSFTADDSYLIDRVAPSATTYKDSYMFDNKSYYYQIAACNVNDVCGPVSSVTSVTVPGNTKTWGFNTSGNYEGWNMANDVTGTSVNGQLNFSISGVDPYITYASNLNLRGKRSHYVKVVMKNNTAATSAQLFWTTDQNPSFSGLQALTMDIVPNDTLYRTYLFDIGNLYQFAGVLQTIRLDINATSGSVNIDSIEIVDGPDLESWEFNQVGNAEGWTSVQQTDGTTLSGSAMDLTFVNRLDPYMDSPDQLKIPARPNQSIRMNAKNNTGAIQAKVQWITDTNSTWDDAKSATISLHPNDPNFTDYIFPVGNSAGWTGTIRKLRIHPFSTDGSTAAGGTINIDRIALSAGLPIANVVPFALPGNNKVDLYWAQNRKETGAYVLRSTSLNGVYTKLNDKPVAMHYTDATAVNGQAYYYKLQYANWLGSGLVSRATGALVPAAGTVSQRESNYAQYRDGVGSWYYQTYNTSTSAYSGMTFVHDQTFNDYWAGGGAKISRVSQNPAAGNDAVLKWVAPITGTIVINGSAHYIVNDRTTGDGATLKIMKNGTQLWTASVGPATFAAETANHSISVSVHAGDAIYFHVNANANVTGGESVWWNPAISY